MLHRFAVHEFARKRNTKGPIIGLIAVLATAIAGYTVYASPLTSYGVFQSQSIDPIPEKIFSAPLENRVKNTRKEVVGFLPYWSVHNGASVYPEYMDQIIYFGLTMNKDGYIVKTDEDNNVTTEWSAMNSERFKDIRSQAAKTDTKILFAVKNFSNDEIDQLISNKVSTRRAIDAIKKILKTYDFDGVNIDFEYVTRTDFPTSRFYNDFLSILVEELRAEKENVIVSLDVNATAIYADNAYDMVKIGELVDQIIIMGYDYHRPVSRKAGPVAPVSMSDDSPSISKSLDSLKGRVPSEKIILGVPLYGYEWQTRSTAYQSATISGTGAVATYKRVRELIEHRDDVSIQYDDLSQSPWLTYSQNGLIKQIYYEDEKSLNAKITVVQKRELGGMALWALGYEGDYIEPWIVIKEGLRDP